MGFKVKILDVIVLRIICVRRGDIPITFNKVMNVFDRDIQLDKLTELPAEDNAGQGGQSSP